MSKLLFLSVVLFAAVAVLPAVPIPCPESGALTLLTGMNSEGCISQDKIFSNFAYSGDVAASAVNVNLVLQIGTSQDIHGWSFVPETAWLTGFTLGYDVTVAPGFPLVAIIQSKDQMNSGFLPNGVTISDFQTGVTPSPLVMSGASGIETVFSNVYNLQTVHTATTATVGANSQLLSYEQTFFERVTAEIPEPMSFVLIGSGLLGLGLLRRRARKLNAR